MATWWEYLRRLWRRPKAASQPPSHVGGRGIPNILGVCEDCGAIVVEGLHESTPTGFVCRRCAARNHHKSA